MASTMDRGWRRAVRSMWGGLLWAGLFSLGLNLLMLAVPLYSMQLYDRVLGSGHVETLLLLSLAGCFALLALGLFDMVRALLLGRVAARFEMAVLPAAVEAAYPKGATQTLRDLASLRQALAGPAVAAIFDAPWLPLALGIIWLLHPMLAAFVGGSAVLLVLLTLVNDLLTRRVVREAAQGQQATLGLAETMQRRREAVVGLGMLERLSRRLCRLDAGAVALAQTASERGAVAAGLTRTVRLLVQSGVMGLGAWLVLEHQLSSGGMFATSILASKALAPVEQMVAAWKGIGPAREGWQRLRALLSQPALVRPTPLPRPQGRLEVEGATVTAENGRALLQNVSFVLEAGECLVLVGPSGAGKSTLCRLLAGTTPLERGTVRLDGAQLHQYPGEQLAEFLGYLPQDVGLLPGSLAENIARMAERPDPRAIVEAASLAGAHELILRLPEGYETRLEEGGFPLSGGQRQRVGLARALYGSPALIVLDEPNASLDGMGEVALAATIARLKVLKITTVIATHRPQLLQQADRILVLEGGTIARFGAKEPVLATLIRPARAA